MNSLSAKNNNHKPKDVPVSVFFGVSLFIVFLLYSSSIIKSIPCGDNIMNVFASNFTHIDIYHIMANLYALYALSRVEYQMGSRPFLALVVFLICFNTLAETIMKKFWSGSKCSIGFSGILFGIMTYEIVSTRKIDIYVLSAIVIMVVLPSIQNPKASLSGHAIGAVSGILGGILWKAIEKYRNK